MTPEQKARIKIDGMLTEAGWLIFDLKEANIHAGRGVAIREFHLKSGHGDADYLLYVDGQAAGVVEAKPAGHTLSGVEIQSDKYRNGLPDSLPAWFLPLPFCYQSTGIETCFTNGLDPDPRSRTVFSFHRPETLASWIDESASEKGVAAEQSAHWTPLTYRSRLRTMPPLHCEGLWPAQIKAITNLEISLATDAYPLTAGSVFHCEFEYIYPFADGNGCMGRLWQSLILARRNPLFADIPVESLIFDNQTEYYQAIQESTQKTDSAPFIAFMLSMILDTVTATAPQVSPQVTPQVGELLAAISGEMGREALQSALGLSDRKSFRARYLKPALADGLIEMTIPDKPNSRLQKYRLTDKGRQWLAQCHTYL